MIYFKTNCSITKQTNYKRFVKIDVIDDNCTHVKIFPHGRHYVDSSSPVLCPDWFQPSSVHCLCKFLAYVSNDLYLSDRTRIERLFTLCEH